jgi:Ca-activated chloride channel family protein
MAPLRSFSRIARSFAVMIIASVLLTLPTRGATEHDGDRIFRSGVDLVHLSVVVTDRRGEYAAAGLGPDDFRVLEDGVPQRLEFVAAEEDVPLDFAILLDTSGSMSHRMPTLQRAATGLLRALRPGDRGLVAQFTDVMQVLSNFTGDVGHLAEAVRRTYASGHTALYDAMYVMLRDFERTKTRMNAGRRRAMMVFSDGIDTTSLLGVDEVLELARATGVSIYPVVLGSPADRRVMIALYGRRVTEVTFDMKNLARETGTRAFFPAQADELAGVYSDIVGELSHQYVLGYVSTNARRDEAFRRVTVQVANGYQARTRSGYIAPKDAVTRDE